MRKWILPILITTTAVLSLAPNGWEAAQTTVQGWRARQEWKQNGLPWNYDDSEETELQNLLEAHVRPGDKVMLLDEPRPCTAAYAAHLRVAYILCPNRVHYPGCGFDTRKADWLYSPTKSDARVTQSLATHNLSNLFAPVATNHHGGTLLRRLSTTPPP